MTGLGQGQSPDTWAPRFPCVPLEAPGGGATRLVHTPMSPSGDDSHGQFRKLPADEQFGFHSADSALALRPPVLSSV